MGWIVWLFFVDGKKNWMIMNMKVKVYFILNKNFVKKRRYGLLIKNKGCY